MAIKRVVAFDLNFPKDDPGIDEYFSEEKKMLDKVPYLSRYELLKNPDPQSKYNYMLLLEFNSTEDLENYRNHSLHVEFCEKYTNLHMDKFEAATWTIF